MDKNIDTERWAEEFVSGLLNHAGLDVEIQEITVDEEDALCLHLSGPDSARVIGRDGQALEALQHLVVSAAIQSGLANRRILVDVERYRERREQRVIDEARKLADSALETGEIQEAPPASARERRLIHMVVSSIEGLTTESTGDGEERYVRIIPTKR